MLFTPLKANDRVAFACPGSVCLHPDHPKITQDYLRQHYQLSAIFAHDTSQQISAQQRADIFLNYLFDDNIKLIAALRGGEGSADTLPFIHVHAEKIKQLTPKMLLGFSDITALLIYFAQHYHWPVIHGTGITHFALGRVDAQSTVATMDLLFGKKDAARLSQLTPLNHQAEENKVINATLTGGNLSLVNISIKDIWEIDTTDKIVFLEDVNEKAHVIIRTLKYLSRLGLFDKVKAVIFGDFTCSPIGCEKQEQETHRDTILKTLSYFAAQHDFPVLYTTQFGHGKTNLPLIYATPYRLQLGKHACLSISS